MTNGTSACGIFLHTRKCMRPRSAWDKPQKGPDDRGSKGPSGKRPRRSSMSNGPRNERSRSNAAYSERSSPAGGHTENVEASTQISVMKRSRASSVDRVPAEDRNILMDDASAAAALQHAIQASPHKFRGTENVATEVGDLTPQPIRRILFPSPTKSQEARSTRNSITRGVKSPLDPSKVDAPQAEKENCPPAADDPDFSEYLHTNVESMARTITPTHEPTSKNKLFKTPLRTPRHTGPPPTTGDFFSSAAKALLRPSTALTPKRTPTRDKSATAIQPLEELSPFTAHLNQLLSDPNCHNNDSNGAINKENISFSPGSNHTLDFPSLPSLHNTPGRTDSHSRVMDFDFSVFDSQDLISTDVPMPSSPPTWFGVYEDPETDLDGGLWGNNDDTLPNMMGSSPLKATPAAIMLASPPKQTPGKNFFENSPGKQTPDRSFFGDSPTKQTPAKVET